MSKWRALKNNVVCMFDMDGVLSDFIYAFSILIGQMYPKLQPKPVDINSQEEYQLVKTWPKEAVDAVWQVIKGAPWWWSQLPPLVDRHIFDRINELSQKCRVYFVTDRVSNIPPAELQTTQWLNYYGIHYPSVICIPWSKKGELASMIKATHVIEDSTRNAFNIYGANPHGCRVFLINRKYNQAKLNHIERINTVDEFLNAMEQDILK